MSQYTKKEAIKIITDCAAKYNNELVDRTLLFLCLDKHKHIVYYEFSFYDWNFMHLTGVKTKAREENPEDFISAKSFYNKCISHKLSPNDFQFSEDGTTHMKPDVLPSVLCKNLSAKMIGTYNHNKPYLCTEKIAGNIKACMGFLVDKSVGGYVPNTLLKEDIRSNISDYVQVIAVFRKKTSDEAYGEITYKAKNTDWNLIKYPNELSYLQSLVLNA